MKNLILLVCLFAALTATAQKETTSFSFAEQTQTGDVPNWLTATGQTFTIGNEEFPVYENSKCGFAVNLRGKYFVYLADLNGTGETLPTGETVYQTCKGTPFYFAVGAKGYYAKYGKRKETN